MTRSALLVVVWCAAAVACGGETDRAAEALHEPIPVSAIAPGISAETLLDATATLASDEFQGRAPGSEGETKTVEYLTEQFAALELTPGNPDGTWVQAVPLVGITPLPG
ncbi:MAG: peptidase M28, partial [Acidobacteria bacterium]|nr:peptidase M28 [Acidobacteriota bacterium]